MALSDLVNDPYSAKRYLAEIGAYDIAGTATMTVRVSDHRLVTGFGDSPAKALYEARIVEPINFQRSMFRSGKVGGSSRTNFGQLVLGNANADAGLDTTAVSKLFGTLTGLYRDWGLRRAGAKEARLSAHEAGQARGKRLAEITAHLDSLGDDELDLRLRQYQRASRRMRMGETNQRGQGGSTILAFCQISG